MIIKFAAAPNVNNYQTPYTGTGCTTTHDSYGYKTPYVGGDYLVNNVVNGSETSHVKNSNLANHVTSQTPVVENGVKTNPAITETSNK